MKSLSIQNAGFLSRLPPSGPTILFQDDYSSSSGWTIHNSGGSFTGGRFRWGTADNTSDHRSYKSLGVTLSDSVWEANFDFFHDDFASNSNETVIFGLTAGTAQPFGGSSQDAIMAVLHFSAGAAEMYMMWKDGTTITYGGNAIPNLVQGTQYYVTLKRLSTTSIELKMFTNTERTSQFGSTATETTIPATITGLTHLQHGNANPLRTNATYFNYVIDNTTIKE